MSHDNISRLPLEEACLAVKNPQSQPSEPGGWAAKSVVSHVSEGVGPAVRILQSSPGARTRVVAAPGSGHVFIATYAFGALLMVGGPRHEPSIAASGARRTGRPKHARRLALPGGWGWLTNPSIAAI